jgi:hypothetical protein
LNSFKFISGEKIGFSFKKNSRHSSGGKYCKNTRRKCMPNIEKIRRMNSLMEIFKL